MCIDAITVKIALHKIRKLQKIFLKIYLNRDYRNRHFYYEKKIHQQMQHVLTAINWIWNVQLATVLQRLFQNVIAQGLLRFRIEDYSTFEIIDQELKAILAAKINKLEKPIAALESVYANALTVAAADPLQFYIFIKLLKNFQADVCKIA